MLRACHIFTISLADTPHRWPLVHVCPSIYLNEPTRYADPVIRLRSDMQSRSKPRNAVRFHVQLYMYQLPMQNSASAFKQRSACPKFKVESGNKTWALVPLSSAGSQPVTQDTHTQKPPRATLLQLNPWTLHSVWVPLLLTVVCCNAISFIILCHSWFSEMWGACEW